MNTSERIARDMMNKVRGGVEGHTYRLDGRSAPEHGYYVGGSVPSLINPTEEQIADFIDATTTDYVGFWEDSETLALYVDAVDHTPSRAYAKRLTALRGEIAFYDVTENQEVRV